MLELVHDSMLTKERQAVVDIQLPAGKYYIVPRTSGIGFQRPIDAKSEGRVQIFEKNGELTELVENTLRDVFRRFDKIHLGGGLDLQEFNAFLERAVGKSELMTADYFRYNVLAKYAHNSAGEVSIRGFLDWFKAWIQQKGTQNAPKVFQRLAYDEDLYPLESRSFAMSVHSPHAIVLYVQDRTQADTPNPNPQLENIEDIVNIEMVRRFGKSV